MKKGILAGILVGLGAFIFVSLYPDNKPLGAFLFSLGLISVFHLQANLYTGKIGSISRNNWKWTLNILFYNAVGISVLAILARLNPHIMEKCMEITANKIGKPIYLALIDAIMCGILIQLSVDLKEKGSITTILCIMCFILCGFEHCIANMFYFVAGVTISNAAMCLLYVFVYIIGNSIGGICMKLFTKEGIYKHENN